MEPAGERRLRRPNQRLGVDVGGAGLVQGSLHIADDENLGGGDEAAGDQQDGLKDPGEHWLIEQIQHGKRRQTRGDRHGRRHAGGAGGEVEAVLGQYGGAVALSVNLCIGFFLSGGAVPVAGQRNDQVRQGQQKLQGDMLTKEQIVRAAVEVLDAEGVNGLNIRRLGAHLGSAASAMYYHVKSKDKLVVLAADHVFGEIPLPDTATVGWREAAASLARGAWSVCHGRAALLVDPGDEYAPHLRPQQGPLRRTIPDDL
ncbi:TetR/AcrR family transcriptional regulator [Streptosporangium sandarakinum]|uniref:TetR/AcrR family transcriptional regulator n=1 Tax=Streptosporangium sandarakinum TaxID=1260955 RepID=UPI003716C6FB